MTNLLDLPDDALVAVLAYLPPRQLFACRVACRRLRDLCLHPDLWRHASLRFRDSVGLVRAALTLVPGIESLDCFGRLDVLAPLVESTSCVVAELTILVSDESEMALATAVILRMDALGGLTRLYLTLHWSATPLLQAVYHLRGLEKLTLDAESLGETLPAAWCELEAEPSLRELVYISSRADPFLQLLLRTHASTLQEVELLVERDCPSAALAAVSGLCSLRCYPSAGFHQLVALPSLHTVDLKGDLNDAPGVPEFLRGAPHLRNVRIWHPDADAVLALSESQSAGGLETLRLGLKSIAELLPSILARFPALKVLEVYSEPSEALLHAVCPSSLPSLASLTASLRGKCLHGWLHGRAVQDLLLRNPQLHLRVEQDFSTSGCSCSWCLQKCHELIDKSHCSFSSHSPTTGCPRDCLQVTA